MNTKFIVSHINCYFIFCTYHRTNSVPTGLVSERLLCIEILVTHMLFDHPNNKTEHRI